MGTRNFQLKSSQGPAEGSGRISLDNDPERSELLECWLKRLKQSAKKCCLRLIGPGDREIDSGSDAESVEGLSSHRLVLPGKNDSGGENLRFLEHENERRELDNLGSGSKNECNGLHSFSIDVFTRICSSLVEPSNLPHD